MREEWPKSCDVITFCVNRFWGLFGFSFQVESKILLCSPQVITFELYGPPGFRRLLCHCPERVGTVAGVRGKPPTMGLLDQRSMLRH